MKKEAIKFIIELLCIALFSFIVFNTVIMPIKVDGNSMYPTLHDDDIGIMSSTGLNEKNIKRFDIVVLDCDAIDKKIIKRVIGLPGEHIIYKDDKLYVNGVRYKEDFLDKQYIKEAKEKYSSTKFTNDFSVTVSKGKIFVLGDNRLGSADSRVFGEFSYSKIEGKRGILLFPFSHMKWVD
ncbi:MAG: signal peptidase I [Thomasclavelia sp.]|nr:signal peptidase I [Thomasclavelia sp.]